MMGSYPGKIFSRCLEIFLPFNFISEQGCIFDCIFSSYVNFWPQALKLMIGENLRDIEIVQLANRTIMQFDKEKIGMLSFEEFLDAVGQTTVYERMVVNV